MYGYVFSALAAASAIFYCIAIPVVNYFRDPKGLRRYPALNFVAPFSDLGFIWEAQKGFRSKTLLNLHKKYPVIRTGPNSLSYGDVTAIKVCLTSHIRVPIHSNMLRISTVITQNALKIYFTRRCPELISISLMLLINQNTHENVRCYPVHMPSRT